MGYVKLILSFILYGILLTILVYSLPGCATLPRQDIYDIEDRVDSIEGGRNIEGWKAWELEKAYGIKRPNGVWKCTDRGQLCVRLLKEAGYQAETRIQQVDGKDYHMYVVTWDKEGEMVELLKKGDVWNTS